MNVVEQPGAFEAGGAEAQLDLIESMIREGRKTTQYWGWNFLLWGVAYLVAMALSNLLTSRSAAAWVWPVMMTLAGVSTALIARWRNRGVPVTTRSRAIAAVWMAVGFGIFVFAFPSILSHRFEDGHTFMAAIEVLLGVAHLASGMVLRWRLQMAVGLLWWGAALVTTFTYSSMGLLISFLIATLLGNIVFGGYLMYLEAQDKARLRTGQVTHV